MWHPGERPSKMFRTAPNDMTTCLYLFDGNFLLYRTSRGPIEIYNLMTRQVIHILEAHSRVQPSFGKGIYASHFAIMDASTTAIEIFKWDSSSTELVEVSTHHVEGSVTFLHFGLYGDLWCVLADGQILNVDIEVSQPAYLDPSTNISSLVCFDPRNPIVGSHDDWMKFIYIVDGALVVWDLSTEQNHRLERAHHGEIFAFMNETNCVAFADHDGVVRLGRLLPESWTG